jgi:hypothetical protein
MRVSTIAEISCGEYARPAMDRRTSPWSPASMGNGAIDWKRCTSGLSKRRPIRRLAA